MAATTGWIRRARRVLTTVRWADFLAGRPTTAGPGDRLTGLLAWDGAAGDGVAVDEVPAPEFEGVTDGVVDAATGVDGRDCTTGLATR